MEWYAPTLLSEVGFRPDGGERTTLRISNSLWSLTRTSSTYGCQSVAAASNDGRSDLYCSTFCDANMTPDCMTTFTGLPLDFRTSGSWPAAVSMTYVVEAVYMIGHVQTAGRGGLSRKEIAITASLSVLGALLLAIGALILMRRRHLRRKSEKERDEFEFPQWTREEPAEDGVPYHIAEVRFDNPRTETSSVSARTDPGGPIDDPPPAYTSPEVWHGDGRPALLDRAPAYDE